MPELVIPDIDPATLELLANGPTVTPTASRPKPRRSLPRRVRPPVSGDPWAAVNAMREQLARCGREFPDSTPLLRQDRDR